MGELGFRDSSGNLLSCFAILSPVQKGLPCNAIVIVTYALMLCQKGAWAPIRRSCGRPTHELAFPLLLLKAVCDRL